MKQTRVATSIAEYPACCAINESEYSYEYEVTVFPTISEMTAKVPVE